MLVSGWYTAPSLKPYTQPNMAADASRVAAAAKTEPICERVAVIKQVLYRRMSVWLVPGDAPPETWARYGSFGYNGYIVRLRAIFDGKRAQITAAGQSLIKSVEG